MHDPPRGDTLGAVAPVWQVLRLFDALVALLVDHVCELQPND